VTTYYVDSVSGNDSSSGVTTGTPWKTLTKVNATNFAAGDQVLFKKGSTFANADLVIDNSGTSAARLVFGAYGTGANPVFDGNNATTPIACGGSWVTIQDITCKNGGGDAEKVGLGVFAADVLIQRVYVTGCALGIQVYLGGDRCRITGCNISDNALGLVGPGSNDDYGGQGITVLAADSVEIDHCTLDRNLTTQIVDYTEDGAAIEVFGATNLKVHDNTADGNQTFSEIGNTSTGNCYYWNNLVTGSHNFQIGWNLKGTDEPEYGPIAGTLYLYNNTVDLTGSQTVGLALHPGNTVSVHNNIFRDTGTISGTRPSTYGQKVDEGHNVYFGGTYTDLWSTANSGNGIASTSTVANPLFVSSADRHLQSGSPAINRGSSNYSNTTDLDGNTRPASAVDAGVYEYQAAPTGGTVNPNSIVDTGTIGTPTVTGGSSGGGGSVSSGYGSGNYGAGVYGPAALTATPTSISNTGTLAAPDVAAVQSVAPAGLVSTPVLTAPAVTVTATSAVASPTSIVDTATLTAPGVNTGNLAATAPDSIVNTATLGTPALGAAWTVSPTSVVDPGTPGISGVTTVALAVNYGAGTYGANSYSGGTNPGAVDSIRDLETLGQPSTIVPGAPAGSGYGGGFYNAGTYTGDPAAPDPATLENYGGGNYGNGIYVGTDARIPASIRDGESFGPPVLGGSAAPPSAGGYGADFYGYGNYAGTVAIPGGAATWRVPVYGDPLHILGIGPWNATKTWKGAPNYGIGSGRAPARPHLQLPQVQSKSFTLRLNEGCEASASLQFDRSNAIIVQEMSTDLWWRRRDPRTNALDMIGRFNTSHNDLSRAEDGSVSSSLQFVDYRTLLGNRMVLKYLSTTKDASGAIVDQQSQWAKGTPVTQIMRFAVPVDMGIDITALNDDDLLGNTTELFHLPPSASITDTFHALLAISPKPWEWWIETPLDLNKAPKLTFALGQRGANKGVTLVDLGTGPTPIANWTMRATSDSYANAIYFQGGDGAGVSDSGFGVITTIPAQIAEYGERDVQDSNSSITGDKNALIKAARTKLVALSDRRPTFTIVLANGFWKGRQHIDVGDTVGIRIKLGGENLTYNNYRVSEIKVDIDATGAETVTLTLGNPLPSGNPRSAYNPLTKVIRKLKNYATPKNAPTFDS
jgi:hypothetical protein